LLLLSIWQFSYTMVREELFRKVPNFNSTSIKNGNDI
jgi:hypothetical protein